MLSISHGRGGERCGSGDVGGGVLGEEETVGVSLGRKEVADRVSVKWLRL